VPDKGGDDIIIGGCGQDLLIGGAGNDMLDGGCEDDILFGDNVELVRRVTYADDATDTIVTRDITSLRYRTLIGQVLYNRSDLDPALSGVAPSGADDSGQLLVDLIARNYRDNNLPWWADLRVLELWHTFEIEAGLAALGTFGNDYLAGGPEDDLIFGQLGNDIIMGDGSIQSAIDGTGVVGAARSPDGCVGIADPNDNNATAAGTCDLVGALHIVPTFEIMPKTNARGEGDGSDYIEGGGGNDIIFGGLGQDDIIGGSSNFFSLIDAEPATGRLRSHLRRRRSTQRPQRQRRPRTRCHHPGRPSRTGLRHDHRRQRSDHPNRRHQGL
jgi:Ca2+-binding RTX toxin-like protein